MQNDPAAISAMLRPRMGQELQILIRDWSIVGNDRIVGTVHNRPGHADGRTIMTSPVVQVRLMGAHQVPVAFTESGSIYWLGDPSEKFGLDKAETFVWEKSRSVPPPPKTVDPELQTTIMRLA